MHNSLQLNMYDLSQINESLELAVSIPPTADDNISLYLYAKNIRDKIIYKLQEIFQFAIANTDNNEIKHFFESFNFLDFQRLTQLHAAESHLEEFATELNNSYLEEMWRTRKARYTNLVLTNSPTTLFYSEDFKPKSVVEIKLFEKQLHAKEKVDLAKRLINHLAQLNNELIYLTITRSAPAA